MNPTMAGNGPGVLEQVRRRHPAMLNIAGILLIIAAVGGFFVWSPADVATPAPVSHTMWLKPQAHVVARSEGGISIGATRVLVPMQEFQKHAENAPYMVSYAAGWNNSGYYVKDGPPGDLFLIYYVMKKPGTDVYLYATEIIPWFCEGYRCDTRFDGRSTFQLNVYERKPDPTLATRVFVVALAAIGAGLLLFALISGTRRRHP